MRRLGIAVTAVALFAGAMVPATIQAGPPQRASLSDIENEVMCLVCGTPLNVSDSPQADRERAFIRTLIARGETKKQIEDALVAQYGRGVLATPSGKGFDLAAWLVPGLAVILAAIGIGFAVVRWRRARPSPAAPLATAAGPGADDRARLRSDLEHYDL
jgi:cytochrome c-type biogenesis protein CcmH